jgi:hypothetical protein
MELDFDSSWLAGFAEAEAAARGQSDRLRSLVSNREADGLDGLEAVIDAADSLGLVAEARAVVEDALDSVSDLPNQPVHVEDVHGGMPLWRRSDEGALLQLPMEPLTELKGVLEKLVSLLRDDPERVSAVVPVGLGGTGGCACGDELPEDAPPGPLFERTGTL